MEQNRPHNIVLALLFIFLTLGLLTVVFFANKQRRLFRSRAQQPGPALVTGVPGQPGPNVPQDPSQTGCVPNVNNETVNLEPCGNNTDDPALVSGFKLSPFTCTDGTLHQGDGQCKSAEEIMRDLTSACGCFKRPTLSQPTPTPPSTSPTPACEEGIKDMKVEECAVPTQPGPQPGPDDTNVPRPDTHIVVTLPADGVPPGEPELRIVGYKCWDGSGETLNTACMKKEEVRSTLEKIEEKCRGKRSPECSVSPGVTKPPTDSCSTKRRGDCNCDSKTDLADFECWRKEFNVYARTNACGAHADFNNDRACTLADFEVLRQNLFQ